MVWEDEPELFLHVPHYGATIYTKRCLDMTKTIPLVANDFDDEFPVPPSNYQQHLVNSPWARADFQRLLDYISPNHYLLNCQGLVFLEVFPFDENENMAASVPIYVRLFDVIDLTNFGFSTRPKKVPPRTIKYLVDGYDAEVDDEFGGKPEFDPSWIINHRDWLDADGILKKTSWPANFVPRNPALEVTRIGTNFGDDDTTNVRRDHFYGVKYPGSYNDPRSFLPVKVVLLTRELSAQGRFDPRIWGLFSNGFGSFSVARMTDGSPSLILH